MTTLLQPLSPALWTLIQNLEKQTTYLGVKIVPKR
jgi:hypothetical protein